MKIRFLPLVAVTLGMALLIGCGTPDTGAQPGVNVSSSTAAQPSAGANASDSNEPPVAGTASYEVIRSLNEAVAQADLIVVGKIVGVGDIYNSARDNRDPSKPASNLFDVTQEYHFQVEQYLKGDGPKVLTIAQVEGAIQSAPEKVTPADIKRAKNGAMGPQLEVGTKYLFLLKKDPDIDGKTRYGGLEPWRFVLGDDGVGGVVAPGDVRFSLPETFIPHPDAPLIPQIEQIIQDQQAGKP